MTDLNKAIQETEDALRDEAKDLATRADNLEWEIIANNLRAQGYTEEDLEVEKKLFDSVVGMSHKLADR
jgi:hypothetical protein